MLCLVSQRQHLHVGVDLVERQVKTSNNFTPNKREMHSLGIYFFASEWIFDSFIFSSFFFLLFSLSMWSLFILINSRVRTVSKYYDLIIFFPLEFECSTRWTNKVQQQQQRQHRHSLQLEHKIEKDQKRQYRISRRSTENRFSTDTVTQNVWRYGIVVCYEFYGFYGDMVIQNCSH